MTENIDILTKRAALKGIEAAVEIYTKRIEELATQYAELRDEISWLESQPPEEER